MWTQIDLVALPCPAQRLNQAPSRILIQTGAAIVLSPPFVANPPYSSRHRCQDSVVSQSTSGLAPLPSVTHEPLR